jgi:hypothetical protein
MYQKISPLTRFVRVQFAEERRKAEEIEDFFCLSVLRKDAGSKSKLRFGLSSVSEAVCPRAFALYYSTHQRSIRRSCCWNRGSGKACSS